MKSKTSDGLVLIDDDAYNPNLPSSRLVSKSEAQLSIEAKSFWLDFENGMLPANIVIGRMLPANIVIGQKLLQGALKSGREYTVATVPYTVYTVSIHIQAFICIDMKNFLPLYTEAEQKCLAVYSQQPVCHIQDL